METEITENGGYAKFLNPNLPEETGPAPTAEQFEAALSLPVGSIMRDSHKPRRIGAGVNFFYVNADLQQVQNAKVNSAVWDAISTDGVVGVVLYAVDGDAPDADYHVRMFAPDAGVWEDAATGSAAAALPGQIALSQTIPNGDHQWIIEQGIEMGRPSRIEADVNISNGSVSSVRIGGNAILVQQGRLFV